MRNFSLVLIGLAFFTFSANASVIKEITVYIYGVNAYGKQELENTNVESYNEKGWLVEKKIYEADNVLSKKNVYEYDEKGNRIKLSFYFGEEELASYYEFKYDDSNNQTLWLHYGPNNELFRKYEYSFDKHGNKIEELEYNVDNNKVKYKTKFTYLKNKLIKSEQFYPTGDLKKYYVIEEDKKGNVIKKELYRGDGSLKYVKTYSFEKEDKEGNWLESKYSKKEVLQRVTKRAITYWD